MRRLLPMALILAGVWLLTGCFTIPTGEHAAHSGEKDFRDYTGGPDSRRPIRVGAVTRAKVIELLGEPTLLERDGRGMGYTFAAVRSVTIYPLCFFMSEPSEVRWYYVRFDFDDHDVLKSLQMTDDTALGREPAFYGSHYQPSPSDWPLGLTSRYTLEAERWQAAQQRGLSPNMPATHPTSRPATQPLP